jgi:RimJ/RimL family protein N-acetyltransferase
VSAPAPPVVGAVGWRQAIATRRLRLVPLTAEDADALHAALDDPGLHAFTGGRPLAREALRERFAALEAGCSPDGAQTWANWVVRRRDAAIGYVQATVTGRRADVAWVIGRAWQGRGYASEAAAAAAGWLLAAGVEELTAHIHPDHAASAGVARAAGLAPTGEADADGEVVWRRVAADGRG